MRESSLQAARIAGSRPAAWSDLLVLIASRSSLLALSRWYSKLRYALLGSGAMIPCSMAFKDVAKARARLLRATGGLLAPCRHLRAVELSATILAILQRPRRGLAATRSALTISPSSSSRLTGFRTQPVVAAGQYSYLRLPRLRPLTPCRLRPHPAVIALPKGEVAPAPRKCLLAARMP